MGPEIRRLRQRVGGEGLGLRPSGVGSQGLAECGQRGGGGVQADTTVSGLVAGWLVKPLAEGREEEVWAQRGDVWVSSLFVGKPLEQASGIVYVGVWERGRGLRLRLWG